MSGEIQGGTFINGTIAGGSGSSWVISDALIQGSGAYGVSFANCSATISDCTISGFDYPFSLCGGNHSLSGNDISGCANQAIAVNCTISTNTTWRLSWGLPIVLISSVSVFSDGGGTTTLTAKPGVEVQLDGRALNLGSSSTYCRRGRLVADGVTFVGGGTLRFYTGSDQSINNCSLDVSVQPSAMSALSFLRPVDYYRGDPEALLAERRRKLRTARELRKQENIRLRQRLLPWTEAKTVTYPNRQSVSL